MPPPPLSEMKFRTGVITDQIYVVGEGIQCGFRILLDKMNKTFDLGYAVVSFVFLPLLVIPVLTIVFISLAHMKG